MAKALAPARASFPTSVLVAARPIGGDDQADSAARAIHFGGFVDSPRVSG